MIPLEKLRWIAEPIPYEEKICGPLRKKPELGVGEKGEKSWRVE